MERSWVLQKILQTIRAVLACLLYAKNNYGIAELALVLFEDRLLLVVSIDANGVCGVGANQQTSLHAAIILLHFNADVVWGDPVLYSAYMF